MKSLILLWAFISLAKARILNNSFGCGGVIVRGVDHEKQTLKTDVDSPYQLAIDYDTSMLFFSYSTQSTDIFKSSYLNLKTNEYGIITGINRGFANAVDSKSHTVYLGGGDGIYEFDFNTKTASNAGITSDNIWQLFYKDGLYFTNYPYEKLYVYKNDEVKIVPELQSTKAMFVAIDNDNNIFYSNSSGLFCYKRIDDTIIYVGDYNINAFTSDINGKIYFTTPSGIYAIIDKTKAVEQLALIDNVYGLAIEGDGTIIYAADDKVIRLKSTGINCITELSIKTYERNDLLKTLP